jgi:hypothetical protein
MSQPAHSPPADAPACRSTTHTTHTTHAPPLLPQADRKPPWAGIPTPREELVSALTWARRNWLAGACTQPDGYTFINHLAVAIAHASYAHTLDVLTKYAPHVAEAAVAQLTELVASGPPLGTWIYDRLAALGDVDVDAIEPETLWRSPSTELPALLDLRERLTTLLQQAAQEDTPVIAVVALKAALSATVGLSHAGKPL